MPPKCSASDIDQKLEELDTYVRGHEALLASRNGSSLFKSLCQRASEEEKKWYFCLHKYARAFSELQKNRVLQTYARLAAHTGPRLGAAEPSPSRLAAEQSHGGAVPAPSRPAAESQARGDAVDGGHDLNDYPALFFRTLLRRLCRRWCLRGLVPMQE